MWWRKRPEVTPDPTAQAARVRAEKDLAQRHVETERVAAMTERWRRIRERNHFGAAIEATFSKRG